MFILLDIFRKFAIENHLFYSDKSLQNEAENGN